MIWFKKKDEIDNPPPGGYYKNGEWNDPNPARGYNEDPDNPELGTRLRRQVLCGMLVASEIMNINKSIR